MPRAGCPSKSLATDRRLRLPQQSACPEGRPSSGDSEAGHFPVHERWSEPPRDLRLQAGTGPNAAESSSRYLAPELEFRRLGQSGLMISEAFPELARHADELCLLNGMRIDTNGHHQGVVRLHTGNEMFVRPSMGSWVVYGTGLGSRRSCRASSPSIRSPISAVPATMARPFCPRATRERASAAAPAACLISPTTLLTDRDQRRQLDFHQPVQPPPRRTPAGKSRV